ncbi:MAG: peptidoglycan DD-metalloendopeptidase family protein [Bacteroidetes bacterium]|nr:peptidoglycan DD-metalloendopeptidase family protein [Bacteroidota bacterium]MBS1941833.1 peptidoglycan DD-metalloendopeptidase family protein [Bacteroidota bacterium]
MTKKTMVMAGGLVLAAALGAYLYLGVDLEPHEEYVADAPLAAEDTLPAPPSAYGIPLDGFELERAQVKPGSTFSDLLSPHGIGAATVDSLVRAAAPVFNVNQIRAGHPIAFIYTDDTARTPVFFVYESDPVDHVVFDLRGLTARMEKRPVHTEEKSISVAVTGALWNDLVDAGATPALAAKLSQVFAWTVDFYRIQKGDRFTMVYRENSVDGQPYGEPELLGVRYEGTDTCEAFLFREDKENGGYYDAKGKSLRKAFLQAPLKYSRISSGFTMRRFHPVQKRWKAHLGTDYAAPYGTPILATGDGTVERAGYSAGNGNYVKLRHNNTYETQYLHMRKILVKQGQHVTQGQVIGEVGSTGLATGPHVCYRFWKNGTQVDPRREVLPSAEPLAAADMPAFDRVRDGLMQRLDQAEAAAKRPNVATF